MNRPNMNKNRYKNDYESEKLGANNLYRRFKNQFETASFLSLSEPECARSQLVYQNTGDYGIQHAEKDT